MKNEPRKTLADKLNEADERLHKRIKKYIEKFNRKTGMFVTDVELEYGEHGEITHMNTVFSSNLFD
jgi:hypothetical protein